MKHPLLKALSLVAVMASCNALATTPPPPVKGSDLPTANALSGSEYFFGLQSGTVKISAAQFATWLQADLGAVFAPASHTHSIANVTGLQAALDGKQGVLTAGTDYVAPTGSGAGLTGLTKSQVGLANVDNTSDANKPVSTATQTALNGKQATLTAGTDYVAPTGSGAGLTNLTKSQVGLANVDNTSDANKPVSTATQTALNGKQGALTAGTDYVAPTGSGAGLTGITKSQVGLANVDNTSDANKPVSTATQTALNGKQATLTAGTDYVAPTGSGAGLTGITKSQVGLANVDNTSDANKPVSTATQTALNGKQATLTAGTDYVAPTGSGAGLTGITKSQVGLANVDNTSDANKPVSTATQTALNGKQGTLTAGTDYVAPTGSGAGLTGITKSQVGLANVDNTSDANKPVSTATQTALNGKQGTLTAGTDYVAPTGSGAGLTNLTKSQVGLANVDNTSDANKPVSTATQTALNGKQGTLTAGTDYVAPTGSGAGLTGITKSQVGLANVDNTSDANKPVSTATQTALNGKQSALTFSTGLVNSSGTITVDTGTSANKIVKLDGSGKLPAVDGSQLTGISGGGGSALTDPNVAYLRSDGSDSTGDGSPGKPYATIQAAANAGFVCFNLGVGNFGNLVMNSSSSICLTGLGWEASSMGSISTDLSYLLILDAGGSVFVAGDITTGASGAADSGNLDLYDVRCAGSLITSGTGGVSGTAGPSSGSSGYNAGNITMHGNCYASPVHLDGGNGANAGTAALAIWAQDQMNFSPGTNYDLVVTTPLASRTFTFGPSDPGTGGVYLGDATGVPSADFGTLANAVSAEASALGVTYTFDGGAFRIVLTANTLGGGFSISDSGSAVGFNTSTAGSGYAYAGSGGNPGTLLIYGPSVIPGGSLLGGTAGTGVDNHGGTTSAPANGTVSADGADLRGGTLTAGQVILGRCSYQPGNIFYGSFSDNGGNAHY